VENATFNLWCVIVGTLFIGMALAATLLKRLPLTTSLLYLAVGFGLGPAGFGLIRINPVTQSALLERVTEIALIISLFTAGLKLRPALTSPLWRLPVRLAFASMTLTVGMIALAGVVGLGLPLGAAILLGAVLAPTDPVLASDVQVEHEKDRDRLRFSLTGEAGFNDGTAFPFVMLGLGLLGLHDIGTGTPFTGWRWLLVDVAWAVGGGLAIGAVMGTLVGQFVLYLRRQHKEALGTDDFLALGLIAFSYGLALLAHTYGFLAVFAAGLALRSTERRSTGETTPAIPSHATHDATAHNTTAHEIATDPETAPTFMARAVLAFNEQLERIGEIAVVVLLGGMLSLRGMPVEALWFVPLLFFVIRPLAVGVTLPGMRLSRLQAGLVAWFGIRGIGSLYYLMYAIEHGVPEELASRLTSLTLTVMMASIVAHGISVTPLMNFYARRRESRHA